MSKFWFGVVLLLGAGCGSAMADSLSAGSSGDIAANAIGTRADVAAVSRVSTHRAAMYQTPISAREDSVQLFLMGLGLCGASGLCVYRASRQKRTGLAVYAE